MVSAPKPLANQYIDQLKVPLLSEIDSIGRKILRKKHSEEPSLFADPLERPKPNSAKINLLYSLYQTIDTCIKQLTELQESLSDPESKKTNLTLQSIMENLASQQQEINASVKQNPHVLAGRFLRSTEKALAQFNAAINAARNILDSTSIPEELVHDDEPRLAFDEGQCKVSEEYESESSELHKTFFELDEASKRPSCLETHTASDKKSSLLPNQILKWFR